MGRGLEALLVKETTPVKRRKIVVAAPKLVINNAPWATYVDGGLFDPFKRRQVDYTLGVDPATHVAITAIAKDGTYAFFEYRPKNSGVQRLSGIEHFIQDTVRTLKLRSGSCVGICMEGYAAGSKFGRELAGECGGIIKLALLRAYGGTQQAYPTIVAPTSLKLFVTGSGKAQKSEIRLRAFQKWQIDAPSHDSADALGLAKIAWCLYDPDVTRLAYEAKVVETARGKTEWPNSLKPEKAVRKRK